MIELFKPVEYWSIKCVFENNNKDKINSKLSLLNEKKIEKFSFKNKQDTDSAILNIKKSNFFITNIESKPYKRNPYAPFRTSTLQQDASRKLGFSASRTMQIAQRLYQGIDIDGDTIGLITYMRTDGIEISKEAIDDCRAFIKKDIGDKYLPKDIRSYSGKKAKNAQEAHEAIRPTDINRTPSSLRSILDRDQIKLYELIWNRTVASQMESAEFERTIVDISNETKKYLIQSKRFC